MGQGEGASKFPGFPGRFPERSSAATIRAWSVCPCLVHADSASIPRKLGNECTASVNERLIDPTLKKRRSVLVARWGPLNTHRRGRVYRALVIRRKTQNSPEQSATTPPAIDAAISRGRERRARPSSIARSVSSDTQSSEIRLSDGQAREGLYRRNNRRRCIGVYNGGCERDL